MIELNIRQVCKVSNLAKDMLEIKKNGESHPFIMYTFSEKKRALLDKDFTLKVDTINRLPQVVQHGGVEISCVSHVQFSRA